jgi:hypothetical protein
MPSLETPPNSAPTPPPLKVRTSRYGELDEHELIHLLDSIDDEVSKARFRESVYISIIICMAIGWFILYGPQVIFHQPRLINPSDILKQRDKEITFLDAPKDLSKPIPHKPTNVVSDKDRTQQTAHPTLDKKTLEQLQAMRKAEAPAPNAPTPQPPAAQPSQEPPPPAPLPQHAPQQQAMIDAPKPAPTRPNFNTSQSAGDAISQAARAAAKNPGQNGDYGSGTPSSSGGLNTGVEVLSDMQGVDFGPYLRRIIGDIKRTWIPLIP